MFIKVKMIMSVVVILLYSTVLNADDVILREVPLGYKALEAAFMSSVDVESKIPDGKYLQLTISYTLNKDSKKVAFIINAPMKIDSIYFSITALNGLKPCLHIIGLKKMQSRYNEIIRYKRLLSSNTCNLVTLYYNGNLSLKLGEETILCSTYNGNTEGETSRSYYYDNNFKVDRLPRIVFKIKAELVDSPCMYLLDKNLSLNLKGLNLEQQRTWLLNEQNKRQKKYRKRHATLGDLQVIQQYLREINKKLNRVTN